MQTAENRPAARVYVGIDTSWIVARAATAEAVDELLRSTRGRDVIFHLMIDELEASAELWSDSVS